MPRHTRQVSKIDDEPPPAPASALHRWRWPIRIAMTVVLLAGVALIVSYGAYEEWPWSTYPSRL